MRKLPLVILATGKTERVEASQLDDLRDNLPVSFLAPW
jgi:hypothetical protein